MSPFEILERLRFVLEHEPRVSLNKSFSLFSYYLFDITQLFELI